MLPKSRHNKQEWSMQEAKSKKEQERVRLLLNPSEQNTKKKLGRPKSVKKEEDKVNG